MNMRTLRTLYQEYRNYCASIGVKPIAFKKFADKGGW